TSGSAGGPGGVIPWGYPTYISLINRDAEGIELKGRWGAWARHVIWYLVEADDLGAIQGFLDPGMTRCTTDIEPVSEAPIAR
ncbi:MAG: hypothetical protein QF368_12310, partial [SAR202 cluster bacterium]|nr:hypothetical protein [SAR202 cluster bacterium]